MEINTIRDKIAEKLNGNSDKVSVIRERRINIDIGPDDFKVVFELMTDELRFDRCSAISGCDVGDGLLVVYHLVRENSIMANLRLRLFYSDAKVKTITDIFPGVELFERELEDLLGITVENLVQGRRYPLPEDWPADDHPLRKNWRKQNQATDV
jgi:NADH:ubiquinone oxidoreductase subunit C